MTHIRHTFLTVAAPIVLCTAVGAFAAINSEPDEAAPVQHSLPAIHNHDTKPVVSSPRFEGRAEIAATFIGYDEGQNDHLGLSKENNSAPIQQDVWPDPANLDWDRPAPHIAAALKQLPKPTYYVFNGEAVAMSVDPTRVAVHRDVNFNDANLVQNARAATGLDARSIMSLTDDGAALWSVANVDNEPDESQRLLQSDDRVKRLLEQPGVDFVSPVFYSPEIEGGVVTITPEILVRLRPAFTTINNIDAMDAIITQAAPDFEIVDNKFGGLDGAYKLRSTARNGFEVLARANQLAEDPRFAWAEPDILGTMDLHIIPNDPGFANCWGLRNTGQFGCCSVIDMDTDESFDITSGLSNVRVLVMDTGSQQNHPDINQNTGRDFTNGAAGGFGTGEPLGSCDSHGTAVAGCVSARWNNEGTVGAAPNVRTISARIGAQATSPCSNSFASYSSSWVVNAINWGVGSGREVSNASFGVGESSAIEDAYQNAYNKGMIHFASAGNGSTGSLGFPARAAFVNSVAAIDPDGTLASFSNWGSGLDFSAPGVSIYTTDRTGALGYSSGSYTYFGGTSAASPYAAGTCALLVSALPHLFPASIESLMRLGCKNLGAGGYDTFYGWGLPSGRNSLDLPGPSNNFCANGVNITAWSYNPSPYSIGSATVYPAEMQEPCEFNNVGVSNSVWYKFTPPHDGTLDINTNGSTYDTVLSVFRGLCIFAFNEACDDDGGVGLNSQLTNVPVDAGEEYLIKVSSYNEDPDSGDLDFNFLYTPNPPSNDLCGFATLIGLGDTSFTNLFAQTDGAAHTTCSFCCGDDQINSDVWYRVTAPCTGYLTVSTCNDTDYDSKLAVYGVAPFIGYPCNPNSGIMGLRGCNDDHCGLRSEVKVYVTAGELIRIRVGGYNASQGTGTLRVICTPDACAADIAGGPEGTADGVVDTFDLLLLLEQWGTDGVEADIAGDGTVGPDGTVDTFDLLKLLELWGACP